MNKQIINEIAETYIFYILNYVYDTSGRGTSWLIPNANRINIWYFHMYQNIGSESLVDFAVLRVLRNTLIFLNNIQFDCTHYFYWYQQTRKLKIIIILHKFFPD